jgi:hypothetical protein
MKYLRLSLAVGILTMFLAITALAGEMPCPITAPAPPSAAGEMPYPVAATTDAVTEVALDLVQSVLALF